MKNNISKENSDNNLRELFSEHIELKKAYKKLQDSFVKTPVENKDIKKDEVVVSKTEENKIDLKVLCRQLEESREYCKEQFLHLYITKERYADNFKYGHFMREGRFVNTTCLDNWNRRARYCDNKLILCNNTSDCAHSLHALFGNSDDIKRWSKKNTTTFLKWLNGDTIKKDFSLLGNLITSEDITDCNNISKISDSLFFVHNTRADELTKHIKDTIEYLKKITQVVKILDKFLALKYSDSPSSFEVTESLDVIAIKILDDDGCLTKEAIEKADSLKKQLHL